MNAEERVPDKSRGPEEAGASPYACRFCGAAFRLAREAGPARAAAFCPYCGEAMGAMGAVEDEGGERRLCPDGDCIGILDAGGRCVVCGRRV